MSAVDAVRVVPGTETRERAGGPTGGGGWFVRIMILVVVVIWIIPTVGVLISSFRPPDLVESTGWWTVFAHPFRLAEWTLQNYRSALSTGGFGNAFLNSLAVTIPSTVIPITIAAFAAYAFSWMTFRGRHIMFVVVVGLLVAGSLSGRWGLGQALAFTGIPSLIAAALLIPRLPETAFRSLEDVSPSEV